MLDYKLGGSLEGVETAKTASAKSRLMDISGELDKDDEPEGASSKASSSSSPSSTKSAAFRPRNPQSMRAWNSLIEEKIEVRLFISNLVHFAFSL